MSALIFSTNKTLENIIVKITSLSIEIEIKKKHYKIDVSVFDIFQ